MNKNKPTEKVFKESRSRLKRGKVRTTKWIENEPGNLREKTEVSNN